MAKLIRRAFQNNRLTYLLTGHFPIGRIVPLSTAYSHRQRYLGHAMNTDPRVLAAICSQKVYRHPQLWAETLSYQSRLSCETAVPLLNAPVNNNCQSPVDVFAI